MLKADCTPKEWAGHLAAMRAKRKRNKAYYQAADAKKYQRVKADPKRMRAHMDAQWRRMYGITAEFVDEMMRLQGGGCAICGRKLVFGKHTHIDHDHATKKVRGVMCAGCNQAEGHIRNSGMTLQEWAESLATYQWACTADWANSGL